MQSYRIETEYQRHLKDLASLVDEAGEDKPMAASTVVSINGSLPAIARAVPVFSHSHSGAQASVERRRRISPEVGRALEMLGHAIEYLADEYVYEGGQFNIADPRVQAAVMLMERNREIYFSCPEVPSLGERLRNWLRHRAA
jgi:hypothetical protein